jgi:hypothetical protein
VGFRDRLRRLRRRAYEKGMTISIPQPGGTAARFSRENLGVAYVVALDRELGRSSKDHPLCQAARRSPDPKWSEGVYAGPEVVPDPPADLSEQ